LASKRVLARVHSRAQLIEFFEELFHGKGGIEMGIRVYSVGGV
jgi:hypothetical protein